jgi:hypothetical protein
MAHLFWSPEGDAMPDVPVHRPACQGVEGVRDGKQRLAPSASGGITPMAHGPCFSDRTSNMAAAVDAMGRFGAAKARSGAWGLR